MNTRKSRHWILSLSLVSTALMYGTAPAYPQSAGSSASGSVGSSSGGSTGTSKSATARNGNPGDSMRSTPPSGRFDQQQNQGQSERTRALEERLQNGQMDKPVAQGQISDRLEQFYRRSAEK